MRIALDCRSVFPGRGGIGRYAEDLAQHLPQAAPEHHFVLLTTPRQQAPLNGAPNVTQMTVPAAMIDASWEQLHLPTLLKDQAIDLYHATCFAVPVVRTTRATVSTVHDVVFRAHPKLVAPALRDYLDTWTAQAIESADAVVTVSNYSQREIARSYPPARKQIDVIYNGLRATWKPANRAALATTRRELKLPRSYILYLGSVEPKKNLARLLDAMVLVRQRAPETVLVLAGGKGGHAFDMATEVARRHLDTAVRALGYVDEEHVAPLLSAADVFIYPSLYEGFGLPPLEAMACGTACVVSNATSLPEVVGDAALVADAHSPESIAEAIVKLLADESLRRSLQQKGRQRAASFTMARMVQQTLAVYERVAGHA